MTCWSTFTQVQYQCHIVLVLTQLYHVWNFWNIEMVHKKKKKKLYFAWLHVFWSTMCTKFVVPSNVLNHGCWSRWLKLENCCIHSSCSKWLKWHFFNNIRCFCCSEITYRCVLQQILRPLEMLLLVLDCSIEEVIDIVKTELYMDKGDHIFTHVIFVCTVFCVVQYRIGSVNPPPSLLSPFRCDMKDLGFFFYIFLLILSSCFHYFLA